MSYNCLTVSCVLRRTILLNKIRAKFSHITLTMCMIHSQRQAHTAHLLIYYDAHLKHNHTIVAHITLTIQVIFFILTNC